MSLPTTITPSVTSGHGTHHVEIHTRLNNTQTTQTGTAYTLALADAGKITDFTNAAAVTVTVPPNSSAAFDVGAELTLRQWGAGQVTLTPGSGVTLRSRGAALTTAGQYAGATLVKRATDEWWVAGDLVL